MTTRVGGSPTQYFLHYSSRSLCLHKTHLSHVSSGQHPVSPLARAHACSTWRHEHNFAADSCDHCPTYARSCESVPQRIRTATKSTPPPFPDPLNTKAGRLGRAYTRTKSSSGSHHPRRPTDIQACPLRRLRNRAAQHRCHNNDVRWLEADMTQSLTGSMRIYAQRHLMYDKSLQNKIMTITTNHSKMWSYTIGGTCGASVRC